MSVAQPGWLMLLLLLPWLGYLLFQRAQGGSCYSNTEMLQSLPPSLRQRFLGLPPALQLLAFAATIVALSQPYVIEKRYAKEADGIAISLVVDISSSMSRRVQQGAESRMTVARKVLQEFILGDGKVLGGRSQDLIAIVTFARYPDVISPLTSSHKTLAALAEDIDVVTRPNEDSTAYGDAVALAAAQLDQYEQSAGLEQDEIKSKIIILLTDGENNSGQYDPLVAAALAKKWGIKIYTISLGEAKETPLGQGSTLSDQTQAADWGLLAMAENTGGIFQRAHDYQSLQHVYRAIDQLETSQLHDNLFEDRVPRFQWPLGIALLAFFLAGLLNATWLRVAGVNLTTSSQGGRHD